MKRLFFYIISIIAISLLPGLALAAVDILQPPAITNNTDLSIQYLQDIFGVVDGWLHGSGSQIMGQMFAVFNSGALILGGIIVAYTMLTGTLNTAHEGEFLGRRWSSIWIPVRSAAGIALLLPKATGYSVIQIFMMAVIIQGIGLADSVWNAALNYLQGGGVIVASSVQGQSQQSYSTIVNQSANILRSMTCVEAVQQALNTAYQNMPKQQVGNVPSNFPAPPNLLDTIVPIVGTPYNNTIQFPGDPSANNPQYSIYAPLQGVCGQVILPPTPSTSITITPDMQNQIEQDKVVATQQIILDMEGPAQAIVNAMLTIGNVNINNNQQNNNPANVLPQSTFYDSTQDFVGLVAPVERMLSQQLDIGVTAAIAQAEQQGWIMAGAYYATLAQINAATTTTIKTQMGPPQATTEAQLQSALGSNGGNLGQKMPIGSQYASAIANLFVTNGLLDQYIQTAVTFADGQFGTPPPTFSIGAATSGLSFPKVTAPHFSGHGLAGSIAAAIANVLAYPISAVITALGDVVQASIQSLDISSILNSLANAQNASNGTVNNPIILIATLGASLMNLVVSLIISAAVSFGMAGIAGILIPGSPIVILPVIIILWSFLLPIVMALFVIGLVMFYYIPLIPFIIFIFAALGWMINVIEAMVAAPLLALGFTHPEGEGLLSSYVEPGVGLIVSVFLTPSMMIIGFIAAYSLSYVGIWVLNQGLFGTIPGANGTTHSMLGYIQQQASPTSITLVFGMPLFLVIYVSLVITILNQAFSLIHVIPDKVMRWIKLQSQTIGDKVGDALSAAKGGIEQGGSAGKEGMTAAAGSVKEMGKQAFAAAAGAPPPPSSKSSSSGKSEAPQTPPTDPAGVGSGSVSVS